MSDSNSHKLYWVVCGVCGWVSGRVIKERRSWLPSRCRRCKHTPLVQKSC